MLAELLPHADLSRSVILRPVGVDDLAAVRYVQQTAFRSLSAEHHSLEESAAVADMVRRLDYARDIVDNNIYAAWIGTEIVGTAGWCPGDDRGETARIRKVFVGPLFARSGIGRLLVSNAEARAARAGFRAFSVRTNASAVPFYEKLGYGITSHGVMPTPMGHDFPVIFMKKQAR